MQKGKAVPAEVVPEPYGHYILVSPLMLSEYREAIAANLSGSANVVTESKLVGQNGVVYLLGDVEKAEWFALNRPGCTVTVLSGDFVSMVAQLYSLFGRTIPPLFNGVTVYQAEAVKAVEVSDGELG